MFVGEAEENYSLQTETTWKHEVLSGTDSILYATCKFLLWEARKERVSLRASSSVAQRRSDRRQMFSLLMKKHFVVGLSEGNNRGKKFERLRYYSSGLIAERGDCLPSDAALVGLHLTGVLTLPLTMS